MGAETPDVSPDVLIVESTYGIAEHEKREDRENRFLGWVDKIVKRGGRCLIPVFALGRAQELLLILDEHWEKHPELQQVHVGLCLRGLGSCGLETGSAGGKGGGLRGSSESKHRSSRSGTNTMY